MRPSTMPFKSCHNNTTTVSTPRLPFVPKNTTEIKQIYKIQYKITNDVKKVEEEMKMFVGTCFQMAKRDNDKPAANFVYGSVFQNQMRYRLKI